MPDKSFANGNGESSSPVAPPLWLKHNPEFAAVYAERFSRWTVMA